MADSWGYPFSKAYTGQYEDGQQFGNTGYLRPGTGGTYFHDGFDFGSGIYGAGSDILAVHDGEITHTGIEGGGLNAVIILSAAPYQVMYQEFSLSTGDIFVSVGDKVTKGQKIGRLNSSHLHLGITKKDWQAALASWNVDDGTWLDPIKIIKENGGDTSSGGSSGSGDTGSDGSGETTPSVAGYKMLKINQFNMPNIKHRYVQLNGELELKAMPKYMYLREAFNQNMAKFYPNVVKRINALQGEHGLEKLFTAPFTTLTLTNGKGAQNNYNVANFKDQQDPFRVNIQGFLGKSNRVEFYCESYLTHLTSTPVVSPYSQGEAGIRKDSLMDTTPKNFDFVVDSSKAYEFLNQNRIKQSRDNAQFALSTNKIQNDNSTRNFQLDQGKQTHLNQITQANQRKQLDYTQEGQWAQQGATALKTGIGMFTGAYNEGSGLSALTSKTGLVGAAGTIAGLGIDEASMGISQHLANQGLAANQGAANQALAVNQDAASKTYHNNLTTSQLIATNTYDNAIANINAGLNDIKNQPDISAVSGADYNFEMAWNNDDVYAITYTVNPQTLVSLAEYFAQFGYSINHYDAIENYMRVRPNFNYVKTKGANIKGNINNKWRNALNMIFDNGITFWRNTDAMRVGLITENYKKG